MKNKRVMKIVYLHAMIERFCFPDCDPFFALKRRRLLRKLFRFDIKKTQHWSATYWMSQNKVIK